MGLWAVFKSLWNLNEPKKKIVPKENKIEEITQNFENPEYEWWEHNEFSEDHGIIFEKPEELSFLKKLRKALVEDELHLIDIPDNINEILAFIRQSDFDYNKLSELIKRDPALTGDFLSTVNSAALNRGIKISNIEQALPRLGQSIIRAVLYMALNKSNIPATPFYEKIAQDILNKSNVVANIAFHLARKFYPDKDQAFLAGLLHDIGKLVILNQCAESFHLPENIDELHAEQAMFKEIFPEHQQRCGAMLAKHWSLEGSIVDAIRWNHRIDEVESVNEDDSHLKLAALINLSDQFARLLGYGEPIEGHDIFETSAIKILEIEDNHANRQCFRRIPELFINATEHKEVLDATLA